MKIDIENFKPNSKAIGALYADACKELLIPYPSFELSSWPRFNELIGGFRTREFTILCGSTGSGKTTLLAHWAKDFLKSNKRLFVMSVETGHTDFVKRSMSAFAGKDMNKGKGVPLEEVKSFHQQFGSFFSGDGIFLSLYDDRINHNLVLQEIEWHRVKKGCEIVFIDNLNYLLEPCGDNQMVAHMDNVVHSLISYSKATDVHIVMVMHPKKTEHGRVESEFDIKGSSTAVQEAYNIFLFNRPKKKAIESGDKTIYDRELMIRKLRRRGENIGKSLWLKYDGKAYTEQSISWTDV
jgi:archaellum biogenesis ATPase FlaH